VALLAPAVSVLGWVWGRRRARAENAAVGGEARGPAKAKSPSGFVLGFFAVSVANTVVLHAWSEARAQVEAVDGVVLHAAVFLMAMAMAAMGLGTDFSHLRENGLRALACAVLGWAGLAVLVACEIYLLA